MIRRIRSRALREDRQAGLSLPELLAASFISLLMLTIVGGLFLQVTRLTASGQATKSATAVAWTALNEMSDVVRQAAQVPISATGTTEGGAIAGSTPTSLIVDSYQRTAVVPSQVALLPDRVAFSVDPSGNVVERRTPSTFANGFYTFTGTSASRTVNGPVLTTGTGIDALFVYYSSTNSVLTQIVPGAGGLTADQASQVTTIGINVVVPNTVSGGADPVRLTNMITMPNVAIVNGGN